MSGSVGIIDDDTNEDPEMFTVQIVSCTNTATSCGPAVMNTTLSITINDDASDGMYCKGYKLVGHYLQMGALPLTIIGFPLQCTIAINFVRVTIFVQPPHHVNGPKTTTDQLLLQTESFLCIITVLP